MSKIVCSSSGMMNATFVVDRDVHHDRYHFSNFKGRHLHTLIHLATSHALNRSIRFHCELRYTERTPKDIENWPKQYTFLHQLRREKRCRMSEIIMRAFFKLLDPFTLSKFYFHSYCHQIVEILSIHSLPSSRYGCSERLKTRRSRLQ